MNQKRAIAFSKKLFVCYFRYRCIDLGSGQMKWLYRVGRCRVKLNDGKTEIIVIWGNLRNVSVPNFGEMSFGNTQLVLCEYAKSLGVVLDSLLSFRSHIDSVVKTCNFHIRNLYMIKDFVNRKNLVTLVHSLIISKVDYCNSLFIGLPNVILKKV